MKKQILWSIIPIVYTATSVRAQDIMVIETNDNTIYEYNVKDIGDVLFLSLENIPSDSIAYHNCPDEHHPHLIDLGLPSGTKWACCNVGATVPEAYGGYFAWGETEEKDIYDDVTYLYSSGIDKDGDGFYDADVSYQIIGDDIAGTEYDAALANWGGSWRMPSAEQCQELDSKCRSIWTTRNGVNGRLFTGPSGGKIFLPAGGHRSMFLVTFIGSYGYYWTSSFDPEYVSLGLGFFFNSQMLDIDFADKRYRGKSVRAVCQ